MHTIVLSYCQENEGQAKAIDQQLKVEGLDFEHIVCEQVSAKQSWSDLLAQQNDKPVFLLISDNFLKSQTCMHEGLKIIHLIQDNPHIHPLIIDGVEKDPDSGEKKQNPTLFDRVSNVIQYMNFWQERYLEVRKLKRHAGEGEEEKINEQVSIVRSISTEIGEFLRLLRSTQYITYEQFASNHFAAFFHLAGIPHHLQERYLEKHRHKTTEVSQLEKSHSPAADQQPSSPAEKEPVLETQEAKSSDTGRPSVRNKKEPSVELLQTLFEDEEEDKPQKKSVFILPEEEINIETEEIEIDLSTAAETSVNVDELLHRAKQLLHDGFVDKALKVYDDILAHEPDNTNVRYQYGLTLANQGNNKSKAIEQLKMIIREDPNNVQAYKKLASLAEAQNDFLLAKQYYESILEIDPSADGIPYKLGVISLNFFSEKPKVAAKYFKQAIKQNKQHVDAHYQYAIVMSEYLGKYKKAIRHFNKTLELNPRHIFANYDLALLYHKTRNRSLAAKYYQRAYSVNPELKTEENDAAFFFSSPEAESDSSHFQDRDTTVTPQEAAPSAPELTDEPEEIETPTSKKTGKTTEPSSSSSLRGPQEGKVVWITGATSGIGRATAEIFAKNGYSLVLTGRRDNRLEALKNNFETQTNNEVRTLNFDVRDRKAVKGAIERLPANWRNCDILINNAGLAAGFGPIHEGNIDDWETMIDTNVKGLLYMTRLISPGMVERKSGHIINIASTAGKEVYPGGNVYCATKFAVEALTRAMRLDLYKYGIKVSQIAPGHVEETEFALVRFHGDQERAKIYEDFQPLKSSDVAETLYFVATRPPHVNIQDVLMMGTQQAGSNFINRSGRDD